jgi:succinate dehydrogenase / fumarate reductase, membrane anchor subunit
MKKVTDDFRTGLGRAKGLGSAKHGVMHWWFQRLTAVAMIPLFIWFTTVVVSVLISPDVTMVTKWFYSPINSLLMGLLVAAMFFHAKLGLQVVVEDYIKCPYSKYTLLFANSFFCFAGSAVCIMAILKLHFLNIQ